ncbi:MAG: FecCD family ABC transporter permease [Bacteroidota bacterium]
MSKSYRPILIILLALLVLISFLHLNNGRLENSFSEFFAAIFNFDENSQAQLILREIRFPRTVIAILAGSSLALSGLLLQTFLNNPLAGPSVLGITSGSSLFVALSLLSGIGFFATEIGVTFSALLGALSFSLLILFFSYFIQSQVSLLLVGMMLGAFTSALVQVLQLTSHANQLKAFTLWSFGSLQQVTFAQLGFIFVLFLVGTLALVWIVKPLNMLVLGERNAQVLGLNVKMVRILVILLSSLFAGVITAFCGPVSFIGLAVPNITKMLFKTQSHGILILGCLLLGALVLLLCDLLIIYLEPVIAVPLNGITSLIGAPVVVWIILKKF